MSILAADGLQAQKYPSAFVPYMCNCGCIDTCKDSQLPSYSCATPGNQKQPSAEEPWQGALSQWLMG
jgi:hypothetical protein